MSILYDVSTVLNGGFSAFNLYVLYRISTIEKDAERERNYFVSFSRKEQETNKDFGKRLSKIEFYLASRFSTWK